MQANSVSIQEKRLYDIAEEYKRRGYVVAVSPTGKRLPGFLTKFRPDIVAEGPNDSVVIEVKSSAKIRGTDYWKELSSVVRQHPGWRLELVINGAEGTKPPTTLGKDLISERLQEGEQLCDHGLIPAALLVTWSAAEAAMRLASEKQEVDLPDFRPSTVISRLYSDGLLDREEYDFLLDTMRIRNAVAHGFYEGGLKSSQVKRLHKITLRLL